MSRLTRVLRWIEESKGLDRAAGALAEAIPSAIRSSRVLRGQPLGHPAHPAVVLLPVGLYAASALLDLVPGEGRAAQAVIGAGLITSPAAIVTGLAEYTTLDQRQRRTAFVHLVANATATACYLTSFRLRVHGFGVVARAVSTLGLAAVGAGGLLGGHLSYSQAAGVQREPVE
ncbi:DUF2231 domain-containing protein [Saccharothrix algeriensis]|uniref:DUF2231 domain-containing protein n=1 Tax=Saccharothrix algeriensis TaxID=173560 RepID=A0A8T8I574_9PSEU|nr:DUF2231 domain-containing protein [Saccharothrix algeriensis]MBM7811175.1 putative membrane protein [Saccharothrix algeriensis]QTR05094.1 DUF2231 domain-containing protein [Saccharothrix algeriensis]